MIENEGGPAAGDRGAPEPIQDDRDGGDPAGQDRPAPFDSGGAPGEGSEGAIDLETVRDRAS
ncbi:MAG TPA: hypothetical protein VF652_07915 [Allosphingosinicella sp.]